VHQRMRLSNTGFTGGLLTCTSVIFLSMLINLCTSECIATDDQGSLVYAIRNVKKGSQICAIDVEERRVSQSQIPGKAFCSVLLVVGKKADHDIVAGQIMSDHDLNYKAKYTAAENASAAEEVELARAKWPGTADLNWKKFAEKQHNSTKKPPAPAQSLMLVDGLYLVLRQADDPKQLQPVADTETLLVNDGRFLEQAERNPVEYAVLDTKAFVPFALNGTPREDHESSGKPRLQIQFAPKQALALEQLTGENVGRTIAIVVGGEIVTCHKIKEAIKGGCLQITRCTKTGCALIYSQLLKERH